MDGWMDGVVVVVGADLCACGHFRCDVRRGGRVGATGSHTLLALRRCRAGGSVNKDGVGR